MKEKSSFEQRLIPLTRLLRMTEVATMTGISKAYVYRLMNQGDFPKPVSLTAKSVAWVDTEVQHWVEDRIAERDTKLN